MVALLLLKSFTDSSRTGRTNVRGLSRLFLSINNSESNNALAWTLTETRLRI
ncbi:MAG: hypothetical protein QOH25_2284 [Acidobacteriota bacterium]|jgi:hypothetical protein|nr:hypothetical protein [Acidobacteriota bacterium]